MPQQTTTIHGADPHLHIAANAADRANKPATLLILAITIFVAMAAWLIVAALNLSTAHSDYKSERQRQARVIMQANQVLDAQAKSPSLENIYGRPGTAVIMPNHIRDVARQVWNLEPDQPLDAIVSIPSDISTSNLTTVTGLQSADVVVRINNQPLDKILEFTQSALEYQFLNSTFILNFTLSPRNPNGWTAAITFRRYQASN